MDGSALGSWLARAAIGVFLVLMILVVARTILLFAALLILPASRALRWLPGAQRAIARLEDRMGTAPSGHGAAGKGEEINRSVG